MEIYYQLVKDKKALLEACKLFCSAEYIGLDTETIGLNPYEGKLRLIQLSNGEETRIIDLYCFSDNPKSDESLEPLRDLIKARKPLKIVHNAKFDSKWIYHCLGVELNGLFDTCLADQLLWFGDNDKRHKLADVASYFLGVNLDKKEQSSDWSISELSDSQLKYAALDALTVWQLYEKINKSLEEKKLEDVAEIEFKCILPITVMELNGFYLDSATWSSVISDLKKQRQKLLKELEAYQSQTSLFGSSVRIKLDSKEEVLDFLYKNGVPVSSETSLLQLRSLIGDYPIARKALEYLRVSETISYLDKDLLQTIEVSNRIHPDFRQITSPFARIGCRNPRLNKLIYDRNYDYCFSVPEGKSLIILEFPLLEVALMVYLSGDENLVEASKSNFYLFVASKVFGNTDEESVLAAKALHQAISYGVGASYFASLYCITQSEAEDLMVRYFQAFPRLRFWLEKVSDLAINQREARSAFGRLYQFRFDETNTSQKLSASRLAKVFSIQASVSDVLKLVLYDLYHGLKGTSAKLVNIVNEQIWIECDQEDEEAVSAKVKKLAQNTCKLDSVVLVKTTCSRGNLQAFKKQCDKIDANDY